MGERAICGFIKEDGTPCRAWPAKKRGSDLCMAHGFPDELKMSREDAYLRKKDAHERRKPPRWFYEEGWDERPFRPIAECAERGGVDRSSVSRWYAWVRWEDAKTAIAREQPRPDGLPVSHFDWTLDHVDLLIEGFLEFRGKYFTTERGKPFITPGFQKEWARGILTAKITGGNHIILAPLRHGKTKLLTHFCIYLFCLDPNIRVIWLGVTQGLAEGPLKQMRGVFESNETLIEDYAGPGGTFQPAYRSLHKWTDKEFTLATRVNMEIPGSNVVALGRGGTVIGKDADVIILDDIEDQAAVAQKGTRDKTKEWWGTDLGGRKEEHTGLFVIGSRQHHDDIYSLVMKEPGWNVTVERAHDPACSVEDDDDHWDCLLFPEFRTYKWLMAQKARLSTQAGGVALWERIYQNVERVGGLVVFSEEDVKACRSPNYKAQTLPTKREHDASGYTLVAGLDPAISGYQATVLFAYQTQPELRIWLVDLDNTEGGGHAAVGRIIRRWHDKYKVKHWVIEENTFGPMSGDREVQEYTSRHGIYVQDWRTGLEKTNQFFGVTALSPLFSNHNIILPYNDKYSRQITDTFVGQLLVWDESNSRNKNRTGFKDDLVMAAWFAWQPIRRARIEFDMELGVELDDYSGFDFNDVPWELAV